MDYELFEMGTQKAIRRTLDWAIIPLDPANRDFQAFLKWNAEQETPIDWEAE